MYNKIILIKLYIPVNINNIKLVFRFCANSFINMNNVAAISPIPIKTDNIELILCFTTSVGLVASNFGYFKFIIIPISSDTNGNIKDKISNNRMLIILNLNLINSIISPINIQGIITTKADITLYIIISNGFIGILFNILIALPSRDIIELVIEVIRAVNTNKPKLITGKKLFILSRVSPGLDRISLAANELNFKDI